MDEFQGHKCFYGTLEPHPARKSIETHDVFVEGNSSSKWVFTKPGALNNLVTYTHDPLLIMICLVFNSPTKQRVFFRLVPAPEIWAVSANMLVPATTRRQHLKVGSLLLDKSVFLYA